MSRFRDDLLYIKIDEIIHETEKAYCLKKDDFEFWMPKSQSELGQPPHQCDDPELWLGLTEWIKVRKDFPKDWEFCDGWSLVGDWPDYYDDDFETDWPVEE